MKKLFILLLILSCVFSVSAQTRIRNALDTLQKFYPREKVYILFNKSEYMAGETIWFSGFVISNYELSPFSTNLFVELYDNEKKLLAIKQLPLLNGQASGQLKLPEKLNENVYFVRAYTQWMLNFPEDNQYIHAITILNPKSPKKLQLQNLGWKAEIFPESGNLIDGIPAKLAVRLFSTSPLPQNWSGYITDAGSPKKIVTFTSLDQNAGIVRLLPFAGHQYQVTVEDKLGLKQVINLPAVVSSGIHLEVNNFYDSLGYTIYFKNIPGSHSAYKLIGTMNDQMVYEASIKKSDSVLKLFMPTAGLYNGILRLTLFDAGDNAVAERLCFVKPTLAGVKTPVFIDKRLNIVPRGFNILRFQSDTISNPFSVMVVDAAAKDPMAEESFLSALWLTGDLSKSIEKPAQYFNQPTSHSAEALDAILLSEIWKGFSWNEILDNKYPPIRYLPDDYISYKGTVFRNKKLIPNEVVNLILYFPDSIRRFVQAKTDSAGSFYMSHLFFYDSAKVYYQLNQRKAAAKNINVQFEKLNKPTLYQSPFPEVAYTLVNRETKDQLTETVRRAITTLDNEEFVDNKYKALEEVKVQAKIKDAKQKLEQELSSGAFRSFNEAVFDFVNENQHVEGYANILQWLQGRVAGLQLSISNGTMVPIIRGSQVSIYIDEMETVAGMLNGFPVSDIAMIKVIKGFFVGGTGGGGGGAVLIYTKRGDVRTANSAPSLNRNLLRGYDKPVDFPAADYNESFYSQLKNDTRDVLFWNAFAVSENEQLEIPIRFYNNDGAKEFRVIVAGFTTYNEPVYFNGIVK